jgi:hypothetical protein
MLNSLRKRASRFRSAFEDVLERRRLAPLYKPDPNNLDTEQHIRAAIAWLELAQDFGTDHGVSFGVPFGGDFQPSYPETTGYICRTFVDLYERTGETELLDRAVQMGIWEADVQLPEGAVMSGKITHPPSPAVFNTGMVILGWNALIRTTGDERFKSSCRRAADWMISMQEPSGHWIRGNSMFAAPGATLYNVKAAWGLCEAGFLLGNPRYIDAAVRNAEYCLSKQEPNGWFRDCCLSDPDNPILHTLAYTMQGLLEIGKLTGRRDFVEAARRAADSEIRIMGRDGFIAGCQDRHFGGTTKWSCLTGSAQTSVVLSELYLLTGENKYFDAARRINRYLMARHDILNPDIRLRGGLAGSWPTWGEYGRFMVLNWATKFLVDALSLEQTIRTKAVSQN